jgi:hypothetical protein
MKITKVSYQKAFVTGPFLQEKIGFEAEMDNEPVPQSDAMLFESPMAVLDRLKDMAEKFHKDANPHLYQESKGVSEWMAPTPPQEHWEIPKDIPTISKDTEKLEISIDNATTLEDLSIIKDACGKSGLVGPYMKKMNQLMTK